MKTKLHATNFINLNGFIRLHNGAIWQQYEKHQKLANAMYELAKAAVGEEKANEILEQNYRIQNNHVDHFKVDYSLDATDNPFKLAYADLKANDQLSNVQDV